MIDKDLLDILCCPVTHQALRLAESAEVETLNRAIRQGECRDVSGKDVRDVVEGGLVRVDGVLLYPVRSGIPVLLADEAIDLATVSR